MTRPPLWTADEADSLILYGLLCLVALYALYVAVFDSWARGLIALGGLSGIAYLLWSALIHGDAPTRSNYNRTEDV